MCEAKLYGEDRKDSSSPSLANMREEKQKNSKFSAFEEKYVSIGARFVLNSRESPSHVGRVAILTKKGFS